MLRTQNSGMSAHSAVRVTDQSNSSTSSGSSARSLFMLTNEKSNQSLNMVNERFFGQLSSTVYQPANSFSKTLRKCRFRARGYSSSMSHSSMR